MEERMRRFGGTKRALSDSPHAVYSVCARVGKSISSWIFSLGLGLLGALSIPAHAAVPNPTVTGPIAATAIPGDPSHNYPFFATNKDLGTNGYIEQEFFIQGAASRYTTPSLATGTVIDSGHPYLTRMIVRRPADPKRFNGAVLVEWLNVTNGFDADIYGSSTGSTFYARDTPGSVCRRRMSASPGWCHGTRPAMRAST
jgi:Alpha/beta hydrolase domain